MAKNTEIEIWNGRLKLSKEKGKTIDTYMIYHSDLMLYIHADTLKFGQRNTEHGWLLMYNENNTYIGSVWINSDTDMKKVEQFLEETK